MIKDRDICLVCGQGKMSEHVITEVFTYKKQECSISDYHIFRCDKCAEEFVSPKSLKESEKMLTDFRRKVDGLLTSGEIKAIRKRLGKTQKELAKMLEVGEKTFARYENGQVTQSRSMDWCLRALDVHPDLFDTIKFGGTHGNDYKYTVIDVKFVFTLKRDKSEYKYPYMYFGDEQVEEGYSSEDAAA